jgi:glutathione synthase
LANIARGATFSKVELSAKIKKECDTISEKLLVEGVSFIAFDILGDKISEINITCPGLVVELSNAYGKNLAKEIF